MTLQYVQAGQSSGNFSYTNKRDVRNLLTLGDSSTSFLVILSLSPCKTTQVFPECLSFKHIIGLIYGNQKPGWKDTYLLSPLRVSRVLSHGCCLKSTTLGLYI